MERLPSCPRCGHDSNVEELGASSSSRWFHCDRCGHLWRHLDPETDVFSFIVASQGASGPPADERIGKDAKARAPRFTLRLEVRYRSPGDAAWRVGLTENLSRSGVLFRSDEEFDQVGPLDLVIVLPGAVPGEPPSRFRCHAEIVRRQPATHSGGAPAIAAAVDGYQLTSH